MSLIYQPCIIKIDCRGTKMIVSSVKANKLCKPPGIGKDDSSSQRVGDEVADQMHLNGQGGMTEITTQPGDTLESIAKGNLKGTGQKVDLGNLLFEQKNILHENFDQIKAGMKGPEKDKNPEDFRTFRGRELPTGLQIKMQTTHTEHSMTPTNPMERQEMTPSSKEKGENTTSSNEELMQQMNNPNTTDYFAGAGNISDTQYALEMFSVGLNPDVVEGMAKYMKKQKS